MSAAAPNEAELLRAIRKALNEARDAQGRYRCRVVRNSVGFDQERRVRYGIGLGSADLIGVVRGGGVLAIEVKAPGGQTTVEQRAWLATLRRFGGCCGVAKSVEDALRILELAEFVRDGGKQ